MPRQVSLSSLLGNYVLLKEVERWRWMGGRKGVVEGVVDGGQWKGGGGWGMERG